MNRNTSVGLLISSKYTTSVGNDDFTLNYVNEIFDDVKPTIRLFLNERKEKVGKVEKVDAEVVYERLLLLLLMKSGVFGGF